MSARLASLSNRPAWSLHHHHDVHEELRSRVPFGYRRERAGLALFLRGGPPALGCSVDRLINNHEPDDSSENGGGHAPALCSLQLPPRGTGHVAA